MFSTREWLTFLPTNTTSRKWRATPSFNNHPVANLCAINCFFSVLMLTTAGTSSTEISKKWASRIAVISYNPTPRVARWDLSLALSLAGNPDWVGDGSFNGEFQNNEFPWIGSDRQGEWNGRRVNTFRFLTTMLWNEYPLLYYFLTTMRILCQSSPEYPWSIHKCHESSVNPLPPTVLLPCQCLGRNILWQSSGSPYMARTYVKN